MRHDGLRRCDDTYGVARCLLSVDFSKYYKMSGRRMGGRRAGAVPSSDLVYGRTTRTVPVSYRYEYGRGSGLHVQYE